MSSQPESDSQHLEEGNPELYMMNDNTASNNWVVHGNFTNTGMPILAGDPHLGCKLPAFWQLIELSYI